MLPPRLIVSAFGPPTTDAGPAQLERSTCDCEPENVLVWRATKPPVAIEFTQTMCEASGPPHADVESATTVPSAVTWLMKPADALRPKCRKTAAPSCGRAPATLLRSSAPLRM